MLPVALESLSGCVLVTFWLRFDHVLNPSINKSFYFPWRRASSSQKTPTHCISSVSRFPLSGWFGSPGCLECLLGQLACRMASTFWTSTRSLFFGGSRVWILVSNGTYVLNSRFEHVLEQKNAFGVRQRLRFESTF